MYPSMIINYATVNTFSVRINIIKENYNKSNFRFPIPVRSAVKSNLTAWCNQKLSNRALNALTVLAFTTEFGKLFKYLQRMQRKNVFGNHNETYG